jgi:hypothetical protein
MDRIDETQEAIARIRMAIDKYNKQRKEDEQEEEPELDDAPKSSQVNSASWRFGAPGRLFNSRTFKEYLDSIGHPVHEFNLLLRDFITEQFPGDRVSHEQHIQVSSKCTNSQPQLTGLPDSTVQMSSYNISISRGLARSSRHHPVQPPLPRPYSIRQPSF